MAYVLGFFAADGNMIKNNRGAHFVSFYSTDKDILEKVRDLLGSNHKVARKKLPNNDKWRVSYQLQIESKEIFRDLFKLGMTPNKSLTIKMPTVPKKLLSHFVRGYFDGDGHVSTYHRSDRIKRSITIITGFTSGSKKFLQKLAAILKAQAFTEGGTLFCTSGHRLCFSKRDSRKLYNFMYQKEGNLYLSRKKIIFSHYFDNLGA